MEIMSRSYRKPYRTDGYKSKWRPKAKRAANATVRNHKKEIPDGMSYKKLSSSWDICDWKFYLPKHETVYRRGCTTKRPLTPKEKALRVRK